MISERRSGKLLQTLQTDVIFFTSSHQHDRKGKKTWSLLCVISVSLMPTQSPQPSVLLNVNRNKNKDSRWICCGCSTWIRLDILLDFCFSSLTSWKTLNRKYVFWSILHSENFSKRFHADTFLSVDFLIFLHFSQSSNLSSWHLLNVLRLEGNSSQPLSWRDRYAEREERWRGRTVCSWIAWTSMFVSLYISPSDTHGLWENKSGRGGGGEKCVMYLCGRRLGATGSL